MRIIRGLARTILAIMPCQSSLNLLKLVRAINSNTKVFTVAKDKLPWLNYKVLFSAIILIVVLRFILAYKPNSS